MALIAVEKWETLLFWKAPFKRRNETASFHPWESCTLCHQVLHSNLEHQGIIYKELSSEELKNSIFQIDTKDSKGLNCSPECQVQSTFPKGENRVWVQFGPMENQAIPWDVVHVVKIKRSKAPLFWALKAVTMPLTLDFIKSTRICSGMVYLPWGICPGNAYPSN